MLILAFDTATQAATVALVRDGELVAERTSRAVRLLWEADDILRSASLSPAALEALVVGIGPGSFTGVRIGLAAARGLALALDLPTAGVSTLDALAAAGSGVLPVVDGGRCEVFTLRDGPVVVRPEELAPAPGTICVGSGALRYRALLEAAGAHVPPDGSELHLPRALHHARLARDFGPAELIEPLYLRVPDAEPARP